jgi:hypothetical protein
VAVATPFPAMAFAASEPTIPEGQDDVLSIGLQAGTIVGAEVSSPDSHNRRSHFRNPVEVSRPIAVRPAPSQGAIEQPWRSANILDLSTGGLCLLLLVEGGFEPQERLLLDLRHQPGFGVPSLSVSLRWFVANGGVVTLGVGFDEPLKPLPQLV